MSADEKQFQEILSRPAVTAALSNPAVVEIINLLKTDPNAAMRKLPSISQRSKKDLEVLVDNGILQMQRWSLDVLDSFTFYICQNIFSDKNQLIIFF